MNLMSWYHEQVVIIIDNDMVATGPSIHFLTLPPGTIASDQHRRLTLL